MAGDVHAVRGQYDIGLDYPDKKVVHLEGFKIGLTHGDTCMPWGDLGSLAALQRKMDCDILIAGQTHEFNAYKYQDRFIINPGSATGACNTRVHPSTPSFCLLDLNGSKAVVYVYRLVDNEVVTETIQFQKKADATPPTTEDTAPAPPPGEGGLLPGEGKAVAMGGTVPVPESPLDVIALGAAPIEPPKVESLERAESSPFSKLVDATKAEAVDATKAEAVDATKAEVVDATKAEAVDATKAEEPAAPAAADGGASSPFQAPDAA